MAVTDNVKLRKQNFTVKNGYFYTFDDDQDALLQKTDDGNTAFSYPCDTVLSSEVKSLEYDGVYFWSLEEDVVGAGPEDNILYIKKWKIDNYICKLQTQFQIDSNSSHYMDSDCFTVEHYHTNISTTTSGGVSTLYLDDYWDNSNILPESFAQILHLGPNQNGEEEDVTTATTISGGVTLLSPTLYDYAVEDEVNFHKHIWVFNNNDGNDINTGALYQYSSYNGGYMGRYIGGAYKDIHACTFANIDSFTEYGSTDMLLYTKGTNTLFVNVNESYIYGGGGVGGTSEDDTVLLTYIDDFTGQDGSDPNPNYWSTSIGSGSELYIVSDRLRMYSLGDGGTSSVGLDFLYYLVGDFDFYIDIRDRQFSVGQATPSTFTLKCEFIWENNFNYIQRSTTNTEDKFISSDSSEVATTSNNYSLRLKRTDTDIYIYYREFSGETPGGWILLSQESGYDSAVSVDMLHVVNNDQSCLNYLDNFTFLQETEVYQANLGASQSGGFSGPALPYYGSMVMDNIESDEYTIDPLSDMSIDRNNMYRLHDGGATYSYNLSPLESFVTSISISSSPAIIAANGISTADIKAIAKDQFLQPISGRRISFSEDGDGSITGPIFINTNNDGEASTEYTSGTTAREVKFTAIMEQTN